LFDLDLFTQSVALLGRGISPSQGCYMREKAVNALNSAATVIGEILIAKTEEEEEEEEVDVHTNTIFEWISLSGGFI
jgi:hypothetical protein